MLSYNPRPEDANEYGPIMGDDVEIKVIAMVSDEHAQVVRSSFTHSFIDLLVDSRLSFFSSLACN